MPIETLRAFSKKQTTPQQVIRALVAHDDWFVPMLWAMSVLRRTTFEQVVGERRGTVELESLGVFTSRAAVVESHERGFEGCYVGPISGTELFSSLPTVLRVLDVNPCLDPAIGWFMEGQTGIDLIREFGQARALERAFDSNAPDFHQRMLAHEFWMYTSPSNGIAVHSRELPYGLLFTDRYAAHVLAETLQGWKLFKVRGEAVFAAVDKLGVDGFIVNAFGADGVNRLVPHGMCARLAAGAPDQVGAR